MICLHTDLKSATGAHGIAICEDCGKEIQVDVLEELLLLKERVDQMARYLRALIRCFNDIEGLEGHF